MCFLTVPANIKPGLHLDVEPAAGKAERIEWYCIPQGAGSTANHVVNAHSWPFFAKAAGNSGMFSMWNAMPIGSETLFSSSYSSPVNQLPTQTSRRQKERVLLAGEAEDTFSLIVSKTGCTAAADVVACLVGDETCLVSNQIPAPAIDYHDRSPRAAGKLSLKQAPFP